MDRNKELAIAAKSGNKESLEILFKNNQGVVILYARHYVSSYVPLADLKQASYLALLEAVKSYDPDSGWYFITYFKVWMRVNAPYQVPYKLKAASAALLHCFFGFLTTSGNFSDHGSRSSKNDRSLSSMCLGISVRRCSKYSYGFRLFAFAVSAML